MVDRSPPAPAPEDGGPRPTAREARILAERRATRRRQWRVVALVLGTMALAGVVTAILIPWEYAYIPSETGVLNPTPATTDQAFDVWGRRISRAEADELRKTAEGRATISPAHGAAPTDEESLRLGRRAFYAETFGNEVFLTDILGMMSGPLRFGGVAKALWDLGGKGTTNLRVPLSESARIGGVDFRAGDLIDTGLDAPAGAYAPLGVKVSYSLGRLRMGITCAACHSTVDPASKRVIQGGPNPDLNLGLMLALASNSAAFFPHAELSGPAAKASAGGQSVVASDGSTAALPDAKAFEDMVDAVFLKWPPGNFDSMIDLVSAPTQLPTSFTRWNHPFAYSGPFAIGPFRGLSVQTNNVHALNSDALAHVGSSRALFDMDPEVYLAILLRNAPDSRYRFDPASGRRPSEFFASVDPTPGAPGVNEAVELPTHPKASQISPDGLLVSDPGLPVWRKVNAMSAWQDTITPPKPPLAHDPEAVARGRRTFEKADCVRCHSGPDLTNHQIIPAPEIGTEPTRAQSLKKSGRDFAPPVLYAFDTPVPIPPGAKVLSVPETADPEQVKLAFAHGDSPGGYKVPSLVGLYWTAPYLHDGGVAAGSDVEARLGIPGTIQSGVPADPAESLRALVDRDLRHRVVAANEAGGLGSARVTGRGHEFWVDAEAGFDRSEQDGLIHYLLSYQPAAP